MSNITESVVDELNSYGLVVGKFSACPYCMKSLPESYRACCGETGHREHFYILYPDLVVTENDLHKSHVKGALDRYNLDGQKRIDERNNNKKETV